MANYNTLKTNLANYVKENGDNLITGDGLQEQLLAMINSLGVGWTYMGVAVLTPSQTNPGTPDQNVFYIAYQPGTYSNFGNLVVNDGEMAILKYNGTWQKDVTGAATAAEVAALGQFFIRDATIIPNKRMEVYGGSVDITDNSNYDLLAISIPYGVSDIRVKTATPAPSWMFWFDDASAGGMDVAHYNGASSFYNNTFIDVKGDSRIVYIPLLKSTYTSGYGGIEIEAQYSGPRVERLTDVTSGTASQTESGYYISNGGSKISAGTCKIVYLHTKGGELVSLETIINGAAVVSIFLDGKFYPAILAGSNNAKVNTYNFLSPGGVIAICGRISDFDYKVYSTNYSPLLSAAYNADTFGWRGSYIIKDNVINYLTTYVTITLNASYDILVAAVPSGATRVKVSGVPAATRIHFFAARTRGELVAGNWISAVSSSIDSWVDIPEGAGAVAVDLEKSQFTTLAGYADIKVDFGDEASDAVRYIALEDAVPSVWLEEDGYYINDSGGKIANANCKLVYLNVTAGDVVDFTTLINNSAVISEYDEVADAFLPLIVSGVNLTEPQDYRWKCVKNGIIVLGGRKSDFIYSVRTSYLSDILANFEATAATDTLPNYYFPYIDNRVRDITDAAFNSGRSDVFGFVSDVHIPHNAGRSGDVFAYVIERTPLRKVFFGGDTLPQNIQWYDKDLPLVDGMAKAVESWNAIISPVREKGRLYNVRGNHDYSLEFASAWVSGRSYSVGDYVIKEESGAWKVYQCTTANSDVAFTPANWNLTAYQAGYNVPRIGQKNSIMADNAFGSKFVSDWDNDKGCYGYVDNPQSKIRYIIIDTSDGPTDDFNYTSNVAQGVSATQFAWLYNHAFKTITSGWKIVVLAHIPCQENCSKSDDYVVAQGSVDLRNFLHAVQTRGSVVVQGVACNFSDLPADNLVWLYYSGHTHRDFLTCVDGYWCVSIAGDIWTNEPNDSALGGIFGFSFPYPRIGTIYEQAVDVVNVDVWNKVTDAFRLGVGFDRRLHHDILSVAVASTLTMVSTMSGTIQWACYDAIGKIRPVTTPVTYTSNNASINSSGLLTGVAAGEVVVAAYSEDENRVEFWGVVVS